MFSPFDLGKNVETEKVGLNEVLLDFILFKPKIDRATLVDSTVKRSLDAGSTPAISTVFIK